MPADADQPATFAAWRALLLAHHACVRAIEADLGAAGTVPLTWYDVLLELRSVPDGLRMQELGERVALSRTRVSRLVDELEQHGLVTRRADPDDGRVTIAAITDEGRRRSGPHGLAKIDEHFNPPVPSGAAVIAGARSVSPTLKRPPVVRSVERVRGVVHHTAGRACPSRTARRVRRASRWSSLHTGAVTDVLLVADTHLGAGAAPG